MLPPLSLGRMIQFIPIKICIIKPKFEGCLELVVHFPIFFDVITENYKNVFYSGECNY